MQGHKKFGMASITAVGGMSAGQDALKFIWDRLAEFALAAGLPLSEMPEATAANLFTIIVLAAFYQTREPDAPAVSAPGARDYDDDTLILTEKTP